MIVLVLNCGSSSIKYQLLDMANMDEPAVKAVGVVERIGLPDGILTHKPEGGGKYKFTEEIQNHEVGINFILEALTSRAHGVIEDVNDIQAVGHRVAHGGEFFTKSVMIDEQVKQRIGKLSDLAPLHNPAHLAGIESMERLLPNVPQVAVFDTSFHQSMPPESFLYAIPYEYYTKHKVRRYGFHGTSHKYVAEKACEFLGLDFNNSKLITCHLGNGASIAAIKNGKSFDTSMGFTPVEGLIMGTRVGNLDAGALLYLMEKENLDLKGINDLINKRSGILGISGISSDMRDVENEAWNNKNERAILALSMYHLRVKRYIGAFAAEIGGIDALIFTGGVGENGPETREEICNEMEFLGVKIDREINSGVRGKATLLSTPDSRVKVAIIPTNEEKVIATDTMRVILGQQK
ncbi:MAG TPA: acetate kinase [Marinilabiliales bacterium]|nr:acetate kinase [Salinivirgaceae bacterium]OFX38455.1 MAG: acetate kinase [Bacteroidetes bacterium GWA2_40_14]OFX76079.1 MAG: acetate kinase [Bacteroidetes bacterium GWD2_40_43]OFX94307.1 MAG: acetate kinase [Bacteroidetes bacterium GWE2_40_63]OFY18786.1 MAG: acetate kinase [Bacteroidetes bacterium GWF2_40_13]OFZ24760.1 MAG: acetate kinase [Bacteroidetes bacterium RIFOXYC2_FULL_40_12]HAM99365.1 acetate kinase [Marinilabiliales bacterium]